MAFYVLKIKYENNLRRLSLQKEEVVTKSFSFAYLETRIRELLQLPATSPLAVTYTDQENDVITMGSDQDLKDALVEQELNPLRIHVTLVNESGMGPQERVDFKPAVFKRLGKELSVEEAFKSALQSCEPLLESCVKSRDQVLQDIAAKLTSAVKNGSAAATASVYGTPRLGAFQPHPNVQPPRYNFGGSLAGPSVTSEGVDSGRQTTSTVHHGVTCDVCGLTPIVGNRWKSTVKFDYDLCSDCYEKNGNETDYAKIEQPKFRPRHRYESPPVGPQPMGSPVLSMGMPPPFNPMMTRHGHFHGGRPFGMRGPFGGFGGRHHFGPSSAEKLYARFVCDVTVFDGTEVAPGTHFVKIWRLRNSGTVPWPVNTTLVFVGGDELGHVQSVPLEIPPQGLGPEAEMEASVDMIAPEKPGRYVSHWRLASPLGPKFGQRLSVVIQVVPQSSLEDAHKEEQILDLVPAPRSSLEDVHNQEQMSELEKEQLLQKDTRSTAQNDESMVVSMDCVGVQSGELEVVNAAEEQFGMEDGGEKTIEKASLLAAALSSPVQSTEFKDTQDQGPITYPMVDMAMEEAAEPITYPVVNPAVAGDAEPITYPVVDAAVAGDAEPERQLLVGRLVAMGFTDSQLNFELLEKNGNDIRKTLDDLCVAEAWDSMLQELEEMGFSDTATNRRLMFKNNGSVKRVVKELVEMYRDGQGKGGKLQ